MCARELEKNIVTLKKIVSAVVDNIGKSIEKSRYQQMRFVIDRLIG